MPEFIIPIIPFLLIFVLITVWLPPAARREICSPPRRRLRLEYAGALVYNVNTTPAVIDSAQEMSPLGCFLCRRMVMLAKWRRDNKSIHKVKAERSKTSSAQDQLSNFVFVFVCSVSLARPLSLSVPSNVQEGQ